MPGDISVTSSDRMGGQATGMDAPSRNKIRLCNRGRRVNLSQEKVFSLR